MRRAPPASSASGSRRGAPIAELRRRSIEEITALAFDGYALGGLAVGESKDEMLDCVAWAAPLLPERPPRYFMGIGDPEGILEVVARGIDMFDCVLPTRTARTGSALVGGPSQPSQRRVSPVIRARSTPSATARPASASPAPTCATSSRSGRCSGFGC